MNEILFRGKRLDNEEWIDGYLVQFHDYLNDSILTMIIPTTSVLFPYGEMDEFYYVDPKTVEVLMAINDLKAIANRMGYKVSKKPAPLPTLLPCVCGRKRLSKWYRTGGDGVHGYFYACKACGLKSEPGKNERERRENWNRMILELGKETENGRCEEM